jgi:hypothetical protein
VLIRNRSADVAQPVPFLAELHSKAHPFSLHVSKASPPMVATRCPVPIQASRWSSAGPARPLTFRASPGTALNSAATILTMPSELLSADAHFCSMLIDNLLTTSQGRNVGILQDVVRRTNTSSSWLAGEDWPSTLRWAFHVLFPTWINISVDRGEVAAARGEDALNIIALKAFLSYTTTPSHTSVRLNVAADHGELWKAFL